MSSKKNKLSNSVKEVLFQDSTPLKIGLAVGIGAFIAVTPTYGFQTALALLIAFLFRLNKPAIVLGTMLAVPWLYPIWIYCDYSIGNWILNNSATIEFPPPISFEFIYSVFSSLLIGSVFFGLVFGAVFFFIAFIVTKVYRNRKYDKSYSIAQ
ncbi:DUF2062 domain-containing protein [bacterium]|nr:DUF2062 domain-containing protein [bacterium]